MTEDRAVYTVPGASSSQWYDVRFEDGQHSGVRVLRGTTIIEAQRGGRKVLFDTAACKVLDGEPLTPVNNVSGGRKCGIIQE